MGILLSIRDLYKHFRASGKITGRGRHPALIKAVDGISFDIMEGEILGLVGESGSGKSTLGRCVLNLIEPTGGSVVFDGHPLAQTARSEMKSLRRNMQAIFQNPYSSFNPKMTIGRSLLNAARFYGLSKTEGMRKIDELLGYVNLNQSLLTRYSNGLSGGEMQRLAIARALIPSPRFIVADEPVSALDVSVQAQILNLLDDMREKFGMTMLFISHELVVVEHICDRVIVMYLGGMVEMGSAEELFKDPAHPYTQALIASKPKMNPDEEKRRITLAGEIPSAMDIPPGCRFYTRCPQVIPGRCEASPPLYRVAKSHFAACYHAAAAAEAFAEKLSAGGGEIARETRR
jgi:oligopeptide/dipeptide ABC transporter ATP-binding protein